MDQLVVHKMIRAGSINRDATADATTDAAAIFTAAKNHYLNNAIFEWH